jgi:ATP-dependent DNA helicase RecQ
VEQIHDILHKYWGFKAFRPLQEDIIRSVMAGKDTLALLPTGGGKSICYQVPALSTKGVCIVISPLIALMKDQADNLSRRGIKAAAIFSGMSYREIDAALDNCIYGGTRFLYLSPERLRDRTVQERLKKMTISLLAVDEAHCISQWGYDFRPAYLEIAAIREIIKAPVLALTATATGEVKKDIQEKLLFRAPNVFQKSFARQNLAYVVSREENKLQKLLGIVRKVGGSGIVYVRNRKKTKEIAEHLFREGVSAEYYHAGLDMATRMRKQEDWIKDRVQVIVSTNAFGMGIDKPDVRFVVHMDLPESPEAYYQEAGRAGRDEKKAYAILLYDPADIAEAEARAGLTFPPLDEIRRVYQCLANYFQLAVGAGAGTSYDFDMSAFCSTYDLSMLKVYSCLHLLELEGLLSLSEGLDMPSRIRLEVSNEDLYAYQVKNRQADAFIKVLLRSYEGLFDDYRKINEAELARRASMEPVQVVQLLKQLHREGILHYLERKNAPQINFLREREDAGRLSISEENLTLRRQRYTEKLKAVTGYVTSTEVCRSRILLSYFGETDAAGCGICDVCLSSRKQLSGTEYSRLAETLKELVSAEPLTIKELVSRTGFADDSKVVKVIQALVDSGELKYSSDNRLQAGGS